MICSAVGGRPGDGRIKRTLAEEGDGRPLSALTRLDMTGDDAGPADHPCLIQFMRRGLRVSVELLYKGVGRIRAERPGRSSVASQQSTPHRMRSERDGMASGLATAAEFSQQPSEGEPWPASALIEYLYDEPYHKTPQGEAQHTRKSKRDSRTRMWQNEQVKAPCHHPRARQPKCSRRKHDNQAQTERQSGSAQRSTFRFEQIEQSDDQFGDCVEHLSCGPLSCRRADRPRMPHTYRGRGDLRHGSRHLPVGVGRNRELAPFALSSAGTVR